MFDKPVQAPQQPAIRNGCFNSWVPVVFLGCLGAMGLNAAHAENAESNTPAAAIEELTVTASSSISNRLGEVGSLSVVDATDIANIAATHVNETLSRVPGVWVTRGSGQEHLAGIRSAVYTGSGACGEFSYLENGIPIRPAGFCNVNNLFEVNTEQAAAIEVWRGPASAVLGGNALHGAINVVSPVSHGGRGFQLEGGPYDYMRAQAWGDAEIAGQQVSASVVVADSEGYRDNTGYGQQKLSLAHAMQWREWEVANFFTATNLNQETGGFVRGFEAFDDDDLRDTNPNPEAYRDAWSLRASSHWRKGAWTIQPYLRRSQMAFLQHFLPGQPLEENEQSSGGVIVRYALTQDGWQGELGMHAELMSGALREFQALPTTGSAFLVETRPAGLHYDYDVDSWMLAAFGNIEVSLDDRSRFISSLRVEHLAYDYDNNHLVGNTRDDGSTCGFGGCLYTRPASRDDSFTNVAARVGYELDIGSSRFYSTASMGFRPPQVTELYRLRGGQTVADLDSERLVSVEIGWRAPLFSLSVYREETRDLILRDSEAFNISDGETESWGVELEGEWGTQAQRVAVSASYGVHKYAFDRAADGREEIMDDNQIDTAPRWLGNVRWSSQWTDALRSELEAVHVGAHYINAANTARYDGHTVLNWRAQYQATEQLQLSLRVVNLLDERYADRADFAFGGYRYFPGMPRQLYAGIRYTFD